MAGAIWCRVIAEFHKHDRMSSSPSAKPTSKVSARKRETAADVIGRMQEQEQALQERIRKEKGRIAKIDRRIAEAEQLIAQQRSRAGGVYGTREADEHAAKQLRVLENRVEHVLARCSKVQAENATLKNRLDDARREKREPLAWGRPPAVLG